MTTPTDSVFMSTHRPIVLMPPLLMTLLPLMLRPKQPLSAPATIFVADEVTEALGGTPKRGIGHRQLRAIELPSGNDPTLKLAAGSRRAQNCVGIRRIEGGGVYSSKGSLLYSLRFLKRYCFVSS